MKIVINACYGGFRLSDEMLKKLGTDEAFTHDRTDPKLIELVEAMPNVKRNDGYGFIQRTDLKVITIPDDITDWTLIIYDGLERIIFAQNGKLYEAYYLHYNGGQEIMPIGGEAIY